MFNFADKPEDAIDLLERILVLNPENRLEAQQILEHRYVRKYFPSITHTIPQIAPHSIVLDIDDNNQLEINDYQERLYDIVKRCKRKQSVRKSSKSQVTDAQMTHPKAKDTFSYKYTSEKENEPNESNVAPLHREKANYYMLETVQVVGNSSEELPTEPSDHGYHKKDYISYNKHNIVNLTHDKTKPRKQHAHAAVSNINNQDTPVLVTSKTYHIDKKHVSKTWLHPSSYDINKPCTKENNKNANVSNKSNPTEPTYQPKQKIKRGKLEFTTDCAHGSDARSPIPIITCEAVESIQNTPYHIERNNVHTHLKPKYKTAESINNKDDPSVENRLHHLPYYSNQPLSGQIHTNQTRSYFETNGIRSEISMKIPQVPPNKNSSMKIMPLARHNILTPNERLSFPPRQVCTNSYLEPNTMVTSEKESKIQLDQVSRRLSHSGYNFFLTNNEVNCNVPEYKTYEGEYTGEGCAKKSKGIRKSLDMSYKLGHKASEALTNDMTGGHKSSVSNTVPVCGTPPLPRRVLLPTPNMNTNARPKIEGRDVRNTHIVSNASPSKQFFICKATNYPIKQLGRESNCELFERRHSDHFVKPSKTSAQYNSQRTVCNGDNHTRCGVPQYHWRTSP